MSSRRGVQRLLTQLRGYSTERFAARAGEHVIPVSDAHRSADSVMQVRVWEWFG